MRSRHSASFPLTLTNLTLLIVYGECNRILIFKLLLFGELMISKATAQRHVASRQLKLLGQRIRELRHQKQLSQEELAARADIHVTYLSALECGKRNASLAIFFSIASALRVAPADLLPSVSRGKNAAD